MKAVELVVLGNEKEGCVFDLNTVSAIFKEGSSWTVYRTEGHLKLTLSDKYYEELLTHIPRGSSECQQLNEENKKLRDIIKNMTGCDPNFNTIESTKASPTKAPIPVENLEKIGRQQTDTIVTDDNTKLKQELESVKAALESTTARAKAGDSLLVSVCRERDELRQQVAKTTTAIGTENVLKGKGHNSRHTTLDELNAFLRKARTECVGKDRLMVNVSISDGPDDEFAQDETFFFVM